MRSFSSLSCHFVKQCKSPDAFVKQCKSPDARVNYDTVKIVPLPAQVDSSAA